MWGFLANSHAIITDNDNLANKPYFCLGLLSNLADLLGLVDARSITVGNFIPIIPRNTASFWARWMIV